MHGKSKKSKNGQEATCPACGSRLRLRKLPRRGQFITCWYCASMLAVTRVAPLRLEWAFEGPFDDGHRNSSHFVEEVNGWDTRWYDEDDYDELEDECDEFEDD